MINWFEIIDDPLADVQLYSAVMGITAAQRLRWASDAQSELQKETKAVSREVEIEAGDLEEDGSIEIDDDIWMVSSCELIGTDGTITDIVEPRSWKDLRKMIRLNQSPVNPPSNYFFAVDKSTVYFYPVPSTGTFLLQYHPFLLPYTATRGESGSGDWAGCSTDVLSDWCQQNGPEQEFWTEVEAIKAYTAAQIMDGSGMTRMYAWKYKKYNAIWEKALADVRSRIPDYSISDDAPSWMPIR